jgi:glycine betaine/choline ABC-type transport system substrate-binding protein
MWHRARIAPFAALLTVFALAGCGEIDRPLVVGAKDFAEQRITAQLLAQTLRAHEIPVEVEDTARTSLDAIGALWAGDLDLYVDYTGSILALSGHPPVDDPAASLAAAAQALEPFGLALGPLLGFRNDYAVLARPGSPAAARPATLSALADARRPLRFGMSEEFRARPLDGYEPLVRRYGPRAEAALLVASSPDGKDRLYAALLVWLAPDALALWQRELSEFMPASSHKYSIRKRTFFGGLLPASRPRSALTGPAHS